MQHPLEKRFRGAVEDLGHLFRDRDPKTLVQIQWVGAVRVSKRTRKRVLFYPCGHLAIGLLPAHRQYYLDLQVFQLPVHCERSSSGSSGWERHCFELQASDRNHDRSVAVALWS